VTCQDCHGTGSVRRAIIQVRGTRQVTLPCPECNGSGIASCCDTAGSAKGDEPATLHRLLFPGPRPASVVNVDRPWPTYAPVNP
jgi:DnaJ-class molecular chaperone